MRKDRLQEQERAAALDPDKGEVAHFDCYEIDGVYFPTREEARAIFDARARHELGISGEEFLRRWDKGEYQPVPDDTEGRKVARLSTMISFARREKA